MRQLYTFSTPLSQCKCAGPPPFTLWKRLIHLKMSGHVILPKTVNRPHYIAKLCKMHIALQNFNASSVSVCTRAPQPLLGELSRGRGGRVAPGAADPSPCQNHLSCGRALLQNGSTKRKQGIIRGSPYLYQRNGRRKRSVESTGTGNSGAYRVAEFAAESGRSTLAVSLRDSQGNRDRTVGGASPGADSQPDGCAKRGWLRWWRC